MSGRAGLTLALLLLSAPAEAEITEAEITEADIAEEEKPMLGFRYWHGDVALGVRAGGGTLTVDGQLYSGAFFARAVKIPGWSPFVGTGMHLSAGAIGDDLHGIDRNAGVARFGFGPELRLGVARGRDVELFSRGWPHVQFYVSSALTMAFAGRSNYRLTEAVRGWNYRFGVGASFPAFYTICERDPVSWIICAFPNSYAFDMEVPLNEPSMRRYGIRFGYGF